MSRAFSTRELAQMWNVSESTIKRWADSELLPCHRTPGGHRRFMLPDIRRFQQEHGFKATGLIKMRHWEEPEEEIVSPVRPLEDWREALLQAAANNQRGPLLEMLQKVYLEGATLSELYDRLVLPVDRQVRERLQQQTILLSQAQLIRNNLEEALARLFADAAWRPEEDQMGLCASLDRRRPLALNGLGRLLLAEGYECLNLGAGLAFAHVAEMVRVEPVNLVCLVSNRKLNPLAEDVAELARVAHSYQIPMLLFGIGFSREFAQCFREGHFFKDLESCQSYVVGRARAR